MTTSDASAVAAAFFALGLEAFLMADTAADADASTAPATATSEAAAAAESVDADADAEVIFLLAILSDIYNCGLLPLSDFQFLTNCFSIFLYIIIRACRDV